MIEVKSLSKRFGPLRVLDGVDLNLPGGRVTALIGPSGGGKSTLLRCINLIERPDAGSVSVGGETVEFGPHRRHPAEQTLRLRRKTGMIFQNFQLFPHRSALDNVMEGMVVVDGIKPAEARERAYALLERVGLRHKAADYPATLSGGQQQRVAIARALARRPEVLLCDEPTSALDPELAAEVVEVLRGLADEGMTMLIATHDLRLAQSVAREVVFLDGGAVVESGPPELVFGDPAQTRTRAFVSTILAGR